MQFFIFILCIFNLFGEFAVLDDPKLAEFEKSLAYYYDVKDPEPLISNYLSALQQLETLGLNHPSLKENMLPYLEKAYFSVSEQRNWHFNIQEAALLEYEIITGNARGEDVSTTQEHLYQIIYHSNSFAIKKAVMIRSFIYAYKTKAFQEERTLSHEEMETLLKLGRLSENILKSLEGAALL